MNLTDRQRLFENPTKEYRGKPFWAWNGKLERKELLHQIDVIKEMGFGGYFMHSRTGLETEYLGEDWFNLTEKCAEYGHTENLESWLYDEDRWPSGSAGGMVTKEEKYRAMFMEMNYLAKGSWNSFQADENTIIVFACQLKEGLFFEKRILQTGEVLAEGETAIEFRIRYSACSDNYNGYCYINTMDKEAVNKYIELTHEKYKEKCGSMFGKEIRGIFTDEPHRGGTFTSFAEGAVNAVPYTPGMFEEFEKRFGYSLKENLPDLFLRTRGGELSKVTRDYFELCQELFIECFAMPVYEWCKKNKLILTGHVLHEDSLCSQTVMQGSLMRFYEYMEYPGMDILSEENKCYWTAKQVSSIARQLNKEWCLSELYGGTGWQMSFEAYKNIGDWQALLGINLRCPHLSWYTMKGEAKRDYPASILHQSPWYREYSYVENYYARIHAALHGGKPLCSLLVLNPIESVWARAYSGSFNGLSAADVEIQRLEEQYASVFHILMGHQIDFDYGEEDIIAHHGRVEKGALYVGDSSYNKVLVAGMDTIRSSTVELLEEFSAQGGKIIFAGEVPAYVDVVCSNRVERLAEKSVQVAFEEKALAEACRDEEMVQIESAEGRELFVQAFQVEGGRIVMLLNTNRKRDYEDITIDLGTGAFLELWDARSGKVTEPQYRVEDGRIRLTMDLEKGGERLFMVAKQKRDLPKTKMSGGGELVTLPDTFRYSLSEKNICVLDMVSVSDEKGNVIPCMEVLKADRELRDALGIPYRGGEMLQPWYQVKYEEGSSEILATISLTYTVEIEVEPENVKIAVEDLEHIKEVFVNGKQISLTSNGKWIDICFDELEIPDNFFVLGKNTIVIVMDYYKTSGIEAVYLLGDFGVEIIDGRTVLTVLPDVLSIGDITSQKLPFYSGSVIYEVEGMSGNHVSVTVREFGGALVKLLGEEEAIIAFPPYQAEATGLCAIEVVLTRRNTFGPLHEKLKHAPAYGPENFVTMGGRWSKDYVLYQQGLLRKPEIRKG